MEVKEIPAICVLRVTQDGSHTIVAEMERESIEVDKLKEELLRSINEFKEEWKKESDIFEKQRLEFMGVDDESAIRMRSKLEYEEA